MATTITHNAGTLTPELIDGYEASRPVGNIIHDVLNRESPDVSLRVPGTRRGQFRCLFPEQSAAIAAYGVLSVPQLFSLSDPAVPAVGMSFVVGPDGDDLTIELDDETRSVWWITVPFVEVAP